MHNPDPAPDEDDDHETEHDAEPRALISQAGVAEIIAMAAALPHRTFRVWYDEATGR